MTTRRVDQALLFVTGALALAFSSGCSALSGLANPKAAWAVSESTPMSVIVRRAEVARATSEQVDRLMTHTKVDEKSKWTQKTAVDKEHAEEMLNAAAAEPVYQGQPGQKLRVVPAEAWAQQFASLCSDESKYPSLVASLSPEVAKKYGELAAEEKKIADLKGAIVKEDAAADEKGATDAQKEEHKKTKKELEEKLGKFEDSFKPKAKEFLATLKEEAAKAPDAVRDRQAVAVINLRRAVDDARAANAAALMRYPMAMPGLTSDLQATASRIVADIVEEKTGKRPDPGGIKPEVKLDGMDVKLELNGIPADKLAGMSPSDVVAETTKRMKTYAERVLTLVAYAGTTEEHLSFEADVLEAWSNGLKLDASKQKDAGVDVGDIKIETGAPAAKKDAKGPVIGRSPAGLALKSCNAPAAPDAQASNAPPAKPDAQASAKKDAKDAKKADAKNTTVPARYTPSDAPAKPAAAPKRKSDCDVAVTSGDQHICL